MDGLTLTQLSALVTIWRDGPLSAGDLASREGVKPPSATRVLAALESRADVDPVLLDLHMPGNHGLAGLAAIRAQYPAVAVVVVSAPPETQRSRAFERTGMNDDKLAMILAKQMPDAEKRARADFVVDTSQGFDAARAQVREILRKVATMPKRRA